MPLSQNGWQANDASLIARYPVPGTDVGLSLREGPAAIVLLYVADRFSRDVEPISNGRAGLDDWGYAERPIRGSATVLSNHASGTAMDLNATQHPLDTNPLASFTARQVDAIRRILADPILGGCVRWGGDYTHRKDPMHFELVGAPEQVAAAAHRITNQEDDDMQMSDPVPGTTVTVGVLFDRLNDALVTINRLRDDMQIVKEKLAAKDA